MSRQTEQLEREAEIARTDLAASLDALRGRLTPQEIVQEAKNYASDTQFGEFARNLGRDVRDNMLPLVLIFAGIAWACIATALRSQRRLAARESAHAMISEASQGIPDLVVTHERWGVERVGEPVE